MKEAEELKALIADLVQNLSAAFAVANGSEAAELIVLVEELNAGLYDCTPTEMRQRSMEEMGLDHLTSDEFRRIYIEGGKR